MGSRQGKRLRFGMLTFLTNIRSTKVLLVTFPWMVATKLQPFQTFGFQNSLSDMNLALINSYRKGIWLSSINTGHTTQAEHFQPYSCLFSTVLSPKFLQPIIKNPPKFALKPIITYQIHSAWVFIMLLTSHRESECPACLLSEHGGWWEIQSLLQRIWSSPAVNCTTKYTKGFSYFGTLGLEIIQGVPKNPAHFDFS